MIGILFNIGNISNNIINSISILEIRLKIYINSINKNIPLQQKLQQETADIGSTNLLITRTFQSSK